MNRRPRLAACRGLDRNKANNSTVPCPCTSALVINSLVANLASKTNECGRAGEERVHSASSLGCGGHAARKLHLEFLTIGRGFSSLPFPRQRTL
jgi:hypothetical protein